MKTRNMNFAGFKKCVWNKSLNFRLGSLIIEFGGVSLPPAPQRAFVFNGVVLCSYTYQTNEKRTQINFVKQTTG